MKYSRKGGELQPTHPNVNSGGKPSTPRLASSASGYLATSSLTLGVETALGALCRQVLLRLASSAPENLSAKCTSCSFNTSTPKFMLEFTSPRKLGSVNSNMNLGVLEAESVKFSPFSGELHLVCFVPTKSFHVSNAVNEAHHPRIAG